MTDMVENKELQEVQTEQTTLSLQESQAVPVQEEQNLSSVQEQQVLSQEKQQSENAVFMQYVLQQIEKIQTQTDYLNYALQALEKFSPVAAGEMAGAAKAQALADVVKCRETTNQQMLRLYEKMYDDLKLK